MLKSILILSSVAFLGGCSPVDLLTPNVDAGDDVAPNTDEDLGTDLSLDGHASDADAAGTDPVEDVERDEAECRESSDCTSQSNECACWEGGAGAGSWDCMEGTCILLCPQVNVCPDGDDMDESDVGDSDECIYDEDCAALYPDEECWCDSEEGMLVWDCWDGMCGRSCLCD